MAKFLTEENVNQLLEMDDALGSLEEIFLASSKGGIINLPRETVRRKIEILKKKKLVNYTTKFGLLPTEKIEEIMKPFAIKELHSLARFIQSLKKHKVLDDLLNLNKNDL